MRMIINVHDIRARRPVAPDCDTQRTVTHARGTPRRAEAQSGSPARVPRRFAQLRLTIAPRGHFPLTPAPVHARFLRVRFGVA